MLSRIIKKSSLWSRAMDISVLSISYLLFSYIAESGSIDVQQLLINMIFYVGIVFITLRLGKRILFDLIKNKSRILCILLGNVAGLTIGTLLAMLLEQFFPGVSERAVVVIFSSVLAFFILGTLSPMVKSSHRDIIPH